MLIKQLNSMVIEFDLAKRSFKQLLLSEFEIDSQHPNKIYWIHCDLSQDNSLEEFTQKLSLPDYVVNLCEQEDAIPKLIDVTDMLTMRIQCLLANPVDAHEITFNNLVMHLTSQYCFTASFVPIPALLNFVENHPRAIKYAKTPCFILFLILDDVINAYSEALLEFDLIADQIDLRIREMHDESYNEIVAEEKQVMKVKRYAATIRDMLMRISGRKITVISEPCRLSLSNLFDHSQIIVGEADAVRDILKGALAQIDNSLMQKMNNTMRVLTAFAAILLPLHLIAGIYGMNFMWIPELQWKYGYFWALGLMVLCAGILIIIFKKNKWF